MYNTTIVSGFIPIQVNTNRTVDQYIEYGKILLGCRLPKIIFMDKDIYETHFQNTTFENTQFIPIKKNELYLYGYKDHITQFDIHTNTPNKDTIEYMLIMCHKTEWIKQAIEKNTFQTQQFIWIDFGIYHIFNNMDVHLFQKKLEDLNDKSYETVRIASCWNINHTYQLDIYKDIAWYFAGGVFGGHRDKLCQFADLMKQICIVLIKEKHHIMWEINIWYLIYLSVPQLFDPYGANHNSSIIENY